MLNCRKASEIALAAQDRKLTFRERIALWFHLSMCHMCRAFMRQLEIIRKTTQTMQIENQKPGTVKLADDARERIRKRLKATD